MAGEAKAGSSVGDGRGMEFLADRVKRREGDREPSMWMWCSHFGRDERKGWRGWLHIFAVGCGGEVEGDCG